MKFFKMFIILNIKSTQREHLKKKKSKLSSKKRLITWELF